VATGVIADPARSGGRSRHGTAIDRLADGVTSVRAAKSAALNARPVSRGADCSWNKLLARPAGFALLGIDTGRGAAGGNTPREALFPLRFPPLDVTPEITSLVCISQNWDNIEVRRVPAADEKPLHWVGSSKRDFLSFPTAVKEDMGNALGIAQFGGTAPTAKPWKGLGPGVLEVVESHDGNAYRAVYTVRFEKAVYVLHAFQKKSPSGIRTAKRDVNLVAERLKAAQRDHEEHYGKPKR